MSARERGEGSIYRPTYRDESGVLKHSAVWWVAYYRGGDKIRESSKSEKRSVAAKLLRLRLADVARGRPVGPDIERTTLEDLAGMVEADYSANERRSLKRLRESLAHLRDYFRGDKASAITSDRVTVYCKHRRDEGAANGTINRELSALKRAFRLAERAGKVAGRPYIAMLAEDNVRKGFFEPEQFSAVAANLPADLQPVAQCAYITGWRVASEIVTREWV